MIDSRDVLSLRSWIAFALLGGLMLGASGCETVGSNVLSTAATATASSPTASATPAAKPKVSFSGNVHGGQQPVSGATVTLWAAGVSAASGVYGTGATEIAQITTGSDGSFSFDNTNGVSPCTIGQYLYITAQGGNPTGSYTNPAAAMLAVIPTPCSSTTGNQYVMVNEVTTVAGVWALQQFMSINPGGTTIGSTTNPPWQIGAPATNTTGLANAFLISQSLANIATGATATSTTSNTIANTINSVLYTTYVNPDYHKINSLANVLSACVNDGVGTECSSLATDTTPASATAPTDTIQMAYYLATHPAGLTMTSTGYTTAPGYLCATYGTANAPFSPTLTCSTSTYPLDWAILVTYRAYQGANTVGTTYAENVAVDGSGNIWTSLTNSGAGSITALNAAGQVVLAPVTSGTLSTTGGWNASGSGGGTFTINGSKGYSSLAIDTLGNAWAASFYDATVVSGTTSEQPIVEITSTGLGTATPSATATGYLVGLAADALAIDSSNNVYVSSQTASARYYINELLSSGSYSTFYTGIGRQSNTYGQIIIDQSGYADPLVSISSSICRENTTINAAAGVNNATFCGSGSGVGSSITLSGTQWGNLGAIDASGNIWETNGTYLNYVNISGSSYTASVTPTAITQFPTVVAQGTATGGLYAPGGVAIDGAGNVWVANAVGTTAGGLSEFVPSTTGATTTLAPLSPTGVTGALSYGFGTANFAAGPAVPVIDPSGNVWVEDKGGSYLYVLVGGAAPVTTPLAANISRVGTRP